MVAVGEVLYVADDVEVVEGVLEADLLDDGALSAGGVYVLLHRLDDLTVHKVTFMPKLRPL